MRLSHGRSVISRGSAIALRNLDTQIPRHDCRNEIQLSNMYAALSILLSHLSSVAAWCRVRHDDFTSPPPKAQLPQLPLPCSVCFWRWYTPCFTRDPFQSLYLCLRRFIYLACASKDWSSLRTTSALSNPTTYSRLPSAVPCLHLQILCGELAR